MQTESVNDSFSRSIYEKVKDLEISVEDEQSFLKKQDLKPNSVHIVVKFGRATVNFGSSVCQISLVVWASENKIKDTFKDVIKTSFVKDGEKYTDYYIEFEKNETCSVPELDTERGLINITKRSPFFNNENKLQLDSSLFHKDAILFDELASRSVKYVSSKSGKGLQIDFPDMPYLVLWDTANDGPFVAIEPWVGLSTCDDESDVFEEKRNLQIAKPGEKKSFTYTITKL